MNEFVATRLKQDPSGKEVVENLISYPRGDESFPDFSNLLVSRNNRKKWVWTLSTIEKNAKRQMPKETPEEAVLLVTIQENSQLSEKEQQRYQQLWRKCEDETLSEDELMEYQALLSQLESQNLKRIKALIALAKSRGKTLGEITTELGLKEGSNAF